MGYHKLTEGREKNQKKLLEWEKERQLQAFPLTSATFFLFLSFFFFSLHKVVEFVQQSLDELTLTYVGADVCVK